MSEHLDGGERVVFEGTIFEVVEKDVDERGIRKTYEFARRSPGVRLIVPTRNRTLLMSREYRHELSLFDVRLPGGKVFDRLSDFKECLSSGRDILLAAKAAAKREAQEEIGIDVRELTHYKTSRVGATVIWDLYYFIVHDYVPSERGRSLGRGEKIETIEVSFNDAKNMCLKGEINEERSALVLLQYLAASAE